MPLLPFFLLFTPFIISAILPYSLEYKRAIMLESEYFTGLSVIHLIFSSTFFVQSYYIYWINYLWNGKNICKANSASGKAE